MANGTYYRGNPIKDFSINFGEISDHNVAGANTWDDWHLIPSSRPFISHPDFLTKYIEIPGMDGYIDLSEYLRGRPVYKPRTGSLTFYVDNGHEDWEIIRTKMVRMLHGKKLKMQLTNDPLYFYEGRFKVDGWSSGANWSQVTISYQLDPYKYTIDYRGAADIIWDTFNFETDYDYYNATYHIEVTDDKPYSLSIADMGSVISLMISCVSGSVTATYGDVIKSVSSGETVELGESYSGKSKVKITGNGTIDILWREGRI